MDALSANAHAATLAMRALEKALAEVETPAQAEQVIRELRRQAANHAPGMADAARGVSAAMAEAIARAADASPPGHEKTAAVFAAAARQLASAPPMEGSPLDQGFLRATNPSAAGAGQTPLDPHRRRLRRALVKDLQPMQRMDTAVFLDINQLPHPPWLNLLMRGLTIIMKRGDALVLGLFVASLTDPKRGSRALGEVLPSLWLSTFIIETPVKKFFRRRRPFIDVVRATVIGRRPGSFSFPSGHSAAAFAGATLLRRHYPRWTAAFYLLAVAVGFSRIYLGAHYPADVVIGGLGGTVLAETSRAVMAKPARGLAAFLFPLLRGIRWLVR